MYRLNRECGRVRTVSAKYVAPPPPSSNFMRRDVESANLTRSPLYRFSGYCIALCLARGLRDAHGNYIIALTGILLDLFVSFLRGKEALAFLPDIGRWSRSLSRRCRS